MATMIITHEVERTVGVWKEKTKVRVRRIREEKFGIYYEALVFPLFCVWLVSILQCIYGGAIGMSRTLCQNMDKEIGEDG